MRIVKNKTRLIAAAVFFALCGVFYVLFPELPRQAVLSAFCLFCFCCAIFESKKSGKTLSAVSLALLLTVCACALLYATDILGGGDFWDIAVRKPYAAIYGAGIALGVWLLFYAFTASASWALRLVTAVFALFGFACHFLAFFRLGPLVPMDIVGTRTALSVLPSYTFSLSPKLAEAILIFAGVVLVSLCRWPPRLSLTDQRKARFGSLILAAAFFGITTTKWHMKRFNLEPLYFIQQQTADGNGALVNFFGNIPFAFLHAPAGFSLEAVDAIAAGYSSDAAVPATEEMPDVIVIMGESWSDLAPKGIVETNVPVMPFIESFRHKKNAHFGKLKVSVRGRQTSCSEFEFFAGTNLQFGMHVAPMIMHINRPTPVMPAFFRQMGYRTVAMHSGNKWAWGRDKALPLMGFDKFYDMRDMRNSDEKWIRGHLSDKDLYKKAVTELSKDGDKPVFLYLITIQTHGGYDNPEYKSPVKIIKPEGPYELAEQYLGLMRESDKDFAEFMKVIEKRKRPTILLAYGDHLPAVGWEYWAKALVPTEHQTWEFSTFYIVWSNFSAPVDKLAAFPALSLNYLGAHFMDIAGMPSTGYQKYLRDCSITMPAITPRGVSDGHGNFIPTDQAASLTAFKEQAILQYNLLKGGDNLRKDFFYLQPAPEQ